MIHFKPFTFAKTEWIFITILAALILLSIGVATVPTVAHGYNNITNYWTDLAIRYGYIGAFFAAFVGSITIVIVFPYTIIVFFLASRGLDPFLLGIMMGLGATLGQMSGYLIGLWTSKTFQKNRPEEYDALERIVHYRPKFVQWLLFFFAVTPLPDDVLFIPLGML